MELPLLTFFEEENEQYMKKCEVNGEPCQTMERFGSRIEML